MARKIFGIIVFLCISSLFLSGCKSAREKPLQVEINQINGQWSLTRGGEPYFIRGAVGIQYMDRLKSYGANSVRVWRDHAVNARQAGQAGLTVLISLPIRAERDGMDYDNESMVRDQFEAVMDLVDSVKDQPSVLMWAIGNELDYVPGAETYKKSVWTAVNDIAKAIKKADPYHPVMTVVGSGRFHKIRDLKAMAPDLELLGVNAYADMAEIPGKLEEYGWDKPYVFTEWGVSGYWQVPGTAWGAPYEENTTEKAGIYREKYENVVLAHSGRCLGSYVFLWGWKQEHTHTWFGMIDAEGRESEAVRVMEEMWTGEPPLNHAPFIDSLVIDDRPYFYDIVIRPGSVHEARVVGNEPDNDRLTYLWEIRPEAEYASYAGHGEVTPPVLPDLIGVLGEGKVSFKAPDAAGAYRIYVYLYDRHNHYAAANKPFLVKEEEE